MFHSALPKRKSLVPADETFDARECDTHAMRRRAGARRELSERVRLTSSTGELIEGWALNIGRGGVRVIVESELELAAEFEIRIGEDPQPAFGRVVWLQEERDGTIAGIEFIGLSGVHRSVIRPRE